MAIQAGIQHILMEGDNQLVVQPIVDSSRAPWHILHLLQHIKRWQAAGIQLSFKHIYREANRTAGWIVCHSLSHPFVTDTCFSLELHAIIVEDAVGCSFVRKLPKYHCTLIYPFQKKNF